jgi:outer membrane cobalamin receptor
MLETGLSLDLAGRLLFRTSIFAHQTSNWIGYGPVAEQIAYGPSNMGKRTVNGVSLDLKWRIQRDSRLGIVGSFLKVQEDEPEKQLLVPEYNLYSYAETGHDFFEDYIFIRLRAVGRAYGKRYGYDYASSQVVFPDIVSMPVDMLFDAKVSFIFSGPEIWIAWENIFDRRYELVTGFSMPPRSLRFGIEWAFWD